MLAFAAGFVTAFVLLVLVLFVLCLLGSIDGEAYEREVIDNFKRNRAWD